MIRKITEIVHELTLKDTNFSSYNKNSILDNTLEYIEFRKLDTDIKIYFKKFKHPHQTIIKLLSDINRNHILYKHNKPIYRFIIELLEKKQKLKDIIQSTREDRRAFSRLEKYKISPSQEYLEAIQILTLGENQIIPFLYMLYSSDGTESINALDKDKCIVSIEDNSSLQKLFSILFYGKNTQRTFHKIVLDKERQVENINAMNQIFDMDIYL